MPLRLERDGPLAVLTTSPAAELVDHAVIDGFARIATRGATRRRAGSWSAPRAGSSPAASAAAAASPRADAVPQASSALFATDDRRRAVRSLLDRGPGHAVFTGR
ncbi:MAG: hypothetical protein IRZ32_06450 [Solirubrobacteraceae bacterium]|nr:hypothetical protein [Solirubrobacteraceae bacterium]